MSGGWGEAALRLPDGRFSVFPRGDVHDLRD